MTGTAAAGWGGGVRPGPAAVSGGSSAPSPPGPSLPAAASPRRGRRPALRGVGAGQVSGREGGPPAAPGAGGGEAQPPRPACERTRNPERASQRDSSRSNRTKSASGAEEEQQP